MSEGSLLLLLLSIPHGPVPSWRKSGKSAENQYACFSSRSPSFLQQGLLFFLFSVTSFPKPRPFPPTPPPSLPSLFRFCSLTTEKGATTAATHTYTQSEQLATYSAEAPDLSRPSMRRIAAAAFFPLPLPEPNPRLAFPSLWHPLPFVPSVRTRPVPSFSVYFEAPLLSAPEATPPPPPAFSPPPPRRLRSQPGLWVFPLRRE